MGHATFRDTIQECGKGQLLNSAGYGVRPDLKLHLVYNPSGPFLPSPQNNLKEDYTKNPMGRFLDDLERNGKKKEYMGVLQESFNPSTLENLMCRSQISIGWDGTFYDCDFNQALGITTEENFPQNIKALGGNSLPERMIMTGEHCFGCTAGAGSSCGGALIEPQVESLVE